MITIMALRQPSSLSAMTVGNRMAFHEAIRVEHRGKVTMWPHFVAQASWQDLRGLRVWRVNIMRGFLNATDE